MNEKLPYEEQLDQAWDMLPLPDEDMAWKDMKRRLDEDDDDRIVVPPSRRGCGIGALLIGVLVLIGIWFLVRHEKWFNKKETAAIQQTKIEQKDNINDINQPVKKGDDQQNDKKDVAEKTKDETETVTVNTDSKNTSLQAGTKQGAETQVEIKTTGAGTKKIKANKNETTTSKKDPGTTTVGTPIKKEKKDEVRVNTPGQPIQGKIDNDKTGSDSTGAISDQILQQDQPADKKKDETTINQKTDSTSIIPDDSNAIKKIDKPKVKTAPSLKKQKEKRPIFFSAGIGLHQQIPIGGQELTTYGSLGRKGILSDYIPSVNLRMEKQDRWFIQSEFRYGAPQYTKQVTYDQKISIDTITQAVTTNSLNLKKTFYHQVPLTFNYYILKNWSVGTGFQWNKFLSAVAEQGTSRRSAGTSFDTVLSKTIVKVSNDSSTALVKSWWQGIVQTQYQWKRFSIGARYSFGLQPYIRFTLPNQPLQEEKNSSFQLFLRYELWRSKK